MHHQMPDSLYALKRHGLSAQITQPALSPGIEIERWFCLDKPFPGLVVSVEYDHLLFVDRRQDLIKTHDMLQLWCHCLCSSQNLFREIGSKGDVRGHNPHAHDFSATRAAPAKHIGRQVYLEWCETVEDIPHAARRFQDIG